MELPTTLPSIEILYLATPTLSVEAVQLRVAPLDVILLAIKLVGSVGASVSGGPA